MDSRPVVKALRNPFRILRAERSFFPVGLLLLLFTLDAINDLIRFFFASQVNPEAVFLADGLFNCLGSLEFNISADSFPFFHQSNGVIGDCPDEMRVQSMNVVLEAARQEVVSRHNPDENDLYMRTIEMTMQLDEESFFSHVMHEDLDAIVHDIREEHKTDSMTADDGNIPTADDVQKNIQMAMDGKTGAEFLAKQFCDAMQIPREKVSENEMVMLINLLGKSPQIKNLNSMRGKTQTPHGPGKQKRKR